MKRKKMQAVIAGVMTMSIALTACGSANNGQAQKKQELSKNVVEEIKGKNPEKLPQAAKNRKDTLIWGGEAVKGKLNPIYSDSKYDTYACELIFDSLVKHDAEGNPIKNVAENWNISKDGLIYTFNLKKGVKFSNGDELTADDVAFTFTVMCDKSYDGPGQNIVGDPGDPTVGLKGFKEYNEGKADKVSGIEVKDKYTIAFTFNKAKASAIYDLDLGILSKKYYGANYKQGDCKPVKDLNLKPMGCGPYVLKDFKAGQEVDFEKNPNYFKGDPKIKNLVMKKTTPQTQIQELQAGGVDVNLIPANPQNVDMLTKAGFIDMQMFPGNTYGYIGLNLRDPKFQDKNVRQALAYGLNRKGFVDSYYKQYAQVCNEPISPVLTWAYAEDVNKYEYNPEKANKMLEEAGWKKKDDGFRYKDGKKFEIHWLTYTDSKYEEALISILKENWKVIGIDVIPDTMDFDTICTKVYDEQKFEMYNMSWSLTPDPDATQIFHGSQDKLGGSNSIGFHNEKNDKLLKDGLAEVDKNKRAPIYKEWAKLINDECPYIFLNQQKDLWAVSCRVKNMRISPFVQWTQDIDKVELADK